MIAASGLDFLALGHIHRPSPQILQSGPTYYAYAGSPVGTGFGELGPRGGWLLDFQGAALSARFIQLLPQMYLEHRLDISLPDNLPVWHSQDLAISILRFLQQKEGPDFRQHHYRLLLEGNLRGQELVVDELSICWRNNCRGTIQNRTDGRLLSELVKEQTVRGAL